MFKVTYLYHSGFIVELDETILLFDVYKVPVPALDAEKKIRVFVSHKHPDHFDFAVFALARKYASVHYFLGSDVKLSDKYLERNGINPEIKQKITHVGKRCAMEYDGMGISTLRSTDAGVAYLIEANGHRIYHGGDLNWWHWSGESESFNQNMAKAYQKEIDSIEGCRFDAAFVPLDPRQEEAYSYGLDYFLKKVQCDYIFPMHMWGKYDWITKYKQTATGRKYRKNIVDIRQELEEWNI